VEKAGVETSARFCRGGKCRSGKIGTILQGWKMRELALGYRQNPYYKTPSMTKPPIAKIPVTAKPESRNGWLFEGVAQITLRFVSCLIYI